MSSGILNSVIMKKIDSIRSNLTDNDIIVLKGIPMSAVDPASAEKIRFEDIAKNKFSYFSNIVGNRSYLTYEEFLLLRVFVLSQYSTVYILNNNIYMEQYPLDLYCSEATKNGLLTHFTESDDPENDSSVIGDIDEIISLYVGIREYNGFLLGSYCEEKNPSDTKIEVINLFDESECHIPYAEIADNFIDIVEEADYIDFVKCLFSEPDEIYVRISNYTGDVYKLKNHLRLLAANWSDLTDIYILQAAKKSSDFEHRDEYSEILKKYWGYSSFRNLPVYDMNKLEEGKKEIINVSQESIISDLVTQVENCEKTDNNFRDVFVTAPTGAGKSVMFQIPAIYLAEKHNLLTIVISPLIGLMNDQVKNLELKNYKAAKTINSDISPIIKQDIIDKVASSEYHILYISPETLLSRSDVEQLIGNRTIGMIVIDEAHIVTTWGKQFRPDYWYLGDHIKRLRKNQLEKKGRAFVIATFTATAIYHGLEDMYSETINSLHMLNPITYLGYVKRNDITIEIETTQKNQKGRTEYELNKLETIEKIIKRAIITNKKTLIYFPTVALINRCYEYLRARHMIDQVAKYHGSLNNDEKTENYEKFLNKEKLVMLATKAFGMGIDINDIELVVHFAPTGNVCDYVQEIGRAARREDINGEAYYQYNTSDFKHINRLHGMSTIKRYQLVELIKKIDELYSNNLKKGGRGNYTKKRNAMLLDAENFTYIFGTPISDEDNNTNKVKTALLTIQKDFENRIGFSPIVVRPIPLFSQGFFEINEAAQKKINRLYPDCIEEINADKHICRVILDKIWKKKYSGVSFPKFKYLVYSNAPELDDLLRTSLKSALCVSIDYVDDYNSVFEKIWNALRSYINKRVISEDYIGVDEIADALTVECTISKYKAKAICEVIIASMDSFRKNNFAKVSSSIARERATNDGDVKYQFNVAVNSYFSWVEKTFASLKQETKNGELYLINDGRSYIKEVSVVLGILESLGVLSFKMIGGADSQLYIYVNQIQSLKNIINDPFHYKNRLLETVADRHLISVKMLTYLYEGGFTSDEIWNYLEDYFLGTIPEKVKRDCLAENPEIVFD